MHTTSYQTTADTTTTHLMSDKSSKGVDIREKRDATEGDGESFGVAIARALSTDTLGNKWSDAIRQ